MGLCSNERKEGGRGCTIRLWNRRSQERHPGGGGGREGSAHLRVIQRVSDTASQPCVQASTSTDVAIHKQASSSSSSLHRMMLLPVSATHDTSSALLASPSPLIISRISDEAHTATDALSACGQSPPPTIILAKSPGTKQVSHGSATFHTFAPKQALMHRELRAANLRGIVLRAARDVNAKLT